MGEHRASSVVSVLYRVCWVVGQLCICRLGVNRDTDGSVGAYYRHMIVITGSTGNRYHLKFMLVSTSLRHVRCEDEHCQCIVAVHVRRVSSDMHGYST